MKAMKVAMEEGVSFDKAHTIALKIFGKQKGYLQVAVRLKNAGVSLTGTSLTAVYTCPANFTARVREIFITNVDGSNAADITLSWTDTSASATYSLLSTLSVAADNIYRIDNANIMLEAGDILKAQAGAANDLVVSAFVEEEITLASQ